MSPSDLTIESVSRVDRKRAKNRDSLVDAARRLFARQGFEATTIAAIAEAADLGFGTFYRYFPDKDAILEAVLDAGRLEIEAVLTHSETDSRTPSEALRGLTKRFAAAARRNQDLIMLMWQVGVRAESANGKRVRLDRLPAERSLPVMLAGAIGRIIEEGVASGDFMTSDALLLARFIASAHMYLLSRPAMKVSERALVDALCELELNALTADLPQAADSRGGRK
jgi:AcrR family transcriptional regulator